MLGILRKKVGRRLLEWRKREAARPGGLSEWGSESLRRMEERHQKEGYLELKFQKWNNPEMQDMAIEVD